MVLPNSRVEGGTAHLHKSNVNGLNVGPNVRGENLDFGFFANQVPKLPGPHPTISQTPTLKASSFRSPILGAQVNEPVKRANSLLDHDLEFMTASAL